MQPNACSRCSWRSRVQPVAVRCVYQKSSFDSDASSESGNALLPCLRLANRRGLLALLAWRWLNLLTSRELCAKRRFHPRFRPVNRRGAPTQRRARAARPRRLRGVSQSWCRSIRTQKSPFIQDRVRQLRRICPIRFGLARSSVDQLIRSSIVARDLLDSGEELSPNTSEAVIRPLSALPGQELQAACWSLVKSLAPESEPRQPLVSKVCRIIRNLVDGDSPRTGPGRRRSRAPLEREVPFVRPLLRLATWSGFNPEVVTSHIAERANAETLFSACTEMILRCRQIQERLAHRFPDVEHNQS